MPGFAIGDLADLPENSENFVLNYQVRRVTDFAGIDWPGLGFHSDFIRSASGREYRVGAFEPFLSYTSSPGTSARPGPCACGFPSCFRGLRITSNTSAFIRIFFKGTTGYRWSRSVDFGLLWGVLQIHRGQTILYWCSTNLSASQQIPMIAPWPVPGSSPLSFEVFTWSGDGVFLPGVSSFPPGDQHFNAIQVFEPDFALPRLDFISHLGLSGPMSGGLYRSRVVRLYKIFPLYGAVGRH